MEVQKTQTQAPAKTFAKLIHAAIIQDENGLSRFLFLRQKEQFLFVWSQETSPQDSFEFETSITGMTVGEAILNARKQWRLDYFRTVNCGFRYNLPERDEHGINALFFQMVSSYASPNGVYFDEELGHNCFINFASIESRDLWQKLKKEGRL